METTSSSPLRVRMRAALTAAMKARDKAAIAALRTTLAAMDNAEAVDRDLPGTTDDSPIAGAVSGLGAGEVARRVLPETEVLAIVRDEIRQRESVADEWDRFGQHERAASLRAEAAVLAALLIQ